VEVKVEIDAEGKVVNVTPVEPLSATQKLLAPQAAQAARLWRLSLHGEMVSPSGANLA